MGIQYNYSVISLHLFILRSFSDQTAHNSAAVSDENDCAVRVTRFLPLRKLDPAAVFSYLPVRRNISIRKNERYLTFSAGKLRKFFYKVQKQLFVFGKVSTHKERIKKKPLLYNLLRNLVFG